MQRQFSRRDVFFFTTIAFDEILYTTVFEIIQVSYMSAPKMHHCFYVVSEMFLVHLSLLYDHY